MGGGGKLWWVVAHYMLKNILRISKVQIKQILEVRQIFPYSHKKKVYMLTL